MLILAFDSTAKAASVALTDGEKLLADFVYDNGLTHSELLLPMAEDVLRKAKKGFDDVEALACNIGPGSFTGVRIGASLVKGLAFGKSTPCVPVSTLEALAENLVPLDGIICPCMDARRGQVYNALFRYENGALRRLTPDRAIALTDLLEELSKDYVGIPVRLTGDGYEVARRALSASGLLLPETPELLKRQNAYATARVAFRLLNEGKSVSHAELSPVYLRLPQAERDRLKSDKT